MIRKFYKCIWRKTNEILKEKTIELIKENNYKKALDILIDLSETNNDIEDKKETGISWEEYRDFIIDNVPYSVFGM